MRRTTLALALAFFATAASTWIDEREASACGGCFHPPPAANESPGVVTDHRMILSVSTQQTTLFDQIHYDGNPASFAWVLPISGQVRIGLSSDLMFATLDELTKLGIDEPPPHYCPGPPESYCPNAYRNCGGYGGADGSSSSDSGGGYSDAASGPPPVTVTKEETVGPYETVQLHSTDPNALTNWLTSHGFVIPDDVKPIVSQYVSEGFDFLALKLVPGANVKSMRPVRVTWAGAGPVLPLRMVAAGTGAVVGITLWVLGEGRYEPQNFPFFTIAPDDVVWDWSLSSSNYTTLRQQKEQALGGRGWQIESSINPSFANLVRLLDNGGSYEPNPSYDAGTDYPAAVDADGGSESPDALRQDDVNALLGGIPMTNVRVTRVRSDLAHTALSADLVLQASQDQSTLPNRFRVTHEINVPPCPTYPPPPACPPDAPPCPDAGNGRVNNEQGSWTDTFAGGCNTSSGAFESPESVAAIAILGVVVVFRMRRRRSDARR